MNNTADGQNPGWLGMPAGFEARKVSVDGVRLHLEVGGEGPNLVLLHGLGGSCEDFHLMAPMLARRFRCFIVDLPGFGRAEKPDAPYTMDYFINIISGLWDQLKLGPCQVAGHSMGGLLALLLASRHPEMVTRVAGICPGGGHLRPRLRQAVLMKLFTTRGDDFRLMPDWVIRYGIADMYADPKNPTCAPLCRKAVSLWRGPERKPVARAFIRAARDILAHPIYEELGSVSAPVRLAVGVKDNAVPLADVQRLMQHIPKNLVGQLTVLPSGHVPIYECPRATAEFVSEA